MPTPDEESVVVPPSPPVEPNSLRASCPPDDERVTSSRTRADSLQEAAHTTRSRQQVPTPEPDTPREEGEKGEHIEDAAAGAERSVREGEESPSPVGSPEASADGWSAQSGVTGAGDGRGTATQGLEGEVGARYLKYPPLRRNAVSTLPTAIAHAISDDRMYHG